MERHQVDECSGTLVQCQCCKQRVRRMDIVNHQYVCPEVVIPCDFVKYGCSFRAIKRKDLRGHLEQYRMQHLQMVEGAHWRLKAKVDILERNIQSVVNRMVDTQQRVDVLEQKVERLETERDVTDDRVDDLEDTVKDAVSRIDEVECLIEQDLMRKNGDSEESITF